MLVLFTGNPLNPGNFVSGVFLCPIGRLLLWQVNHRSIQSKGVTMEKSMAVIANAVGATLGVDVIFQGSDIAATDGKKVILPAAAAIKNDLAFKGLIVHEGAHIRLTDFDYINEHFVNNRELHHIHNLVEDIRIEKVMFRMYKGARSWLDATVTWAIKSKWFKPSKMDATPSTKVLTGLLHGLRAFELGQPIPFAANSVQIARDAGEMGFFDRLYQIAVRGSNGSFIEGVRAAEEIYELLRTNQPRIEKPDQNPNQSSSSNSGANDPSQQQGDESKSQDSKENDLNNASGQPVSSGNAKQEGNELGISPDFKSDLGDMMKSFLNKESHGKKTEATYRHFESTHSPTKVHRDLVRLIGHQMGSRLEMMLIAQTEDHEYLTRSGHRLCGKRITQAVMGGSTFQRRELGEEIDTAVSIVVDASGSMKELISVVLSTAYCLCDVMEKLDIPVSCLTFNEHFTTQVKEFEQSSSQCGSAFMVGSGGGTPMEAGVIRGAKDLSTRQETRRVLICLSDGRPDNLDNTLTALRTAVYEGLDVACLYLMDDVSDPAVGVQDMINRINKIDGAHATLVFRRDAVKGLFKVLEAML
jgi:hypothetical protein